MITGFTADGLFPTFNSMDEVFGFSWSEDMGKMEKAKGSGSVGITTDGAMNAVYGPYMENLAYNKHNTYAVLSKQPYKTARRFQQDLSMTSSMSSGVVRGGFAPQPLYGDYLQFEMPYKVLAHRFAMNIGMAEIGEKGIDDLMTWKQQMDFEGDTWLFSMNNDLLRPVESDPIVAQGAQANWQYGSATGSTEIVGLESIERIISNADEGQYLKANYNVPWRMSNDDSIRIPSTDSNQALAKYRNPHASDFVGLENNINCYVDHNYDATTDGTTNSTATNRQLTLPMIDNMFLECMPYWNDNSTSGKVVITGYDTLAKMQMILQPQQRYQGFVDAQFDVNGVKTVQGQNTGFQCATYNGAPIIPDKQVAKDGVSRIFALDNSILFNGVLRAPTVELSENPIITGKYIRLCDMNYFGETQVNGPFKGLGKIIHLK